MITLTRNAPLEKRNTFRMKVRCALLAEYDTVEELRDILRGISSGAFPAPALVLGGGSNLLFTGDFPGTVLHSRIRGREVVEDDGTQLLLRVGSGEVMDEVCLHCAGKGWWGLENLSGIPGEAGASAVQNVGAYGVEAGDRIVRVHCLDRESLESCDIEAADCAYAYRESRFKQEWKSRYVITAVTFRLGRKSAPVLDYGGVRKRLDAEMPGWREETLTPLAMRDTILKIRREKLPDPAEVGSAGSFFRNPLLDAQAYGELCRKAEALGLGEVPSYPSPDGRTKVPAAWLLERCGLKGLRDGAAGTWPSQPLVLVNATGNALPGDILRLEERLVRTVRERFGVTLVPEVEHIESH